MGCIVTFAKADSDADLCVQGGGRDRRQRAQGDRGGGQGAGDAVGAVAGAGVGPRVKPGGRLRWSGSSRRRSTPGSRARGLLRECLDETPLPARHSERLAIPTGIAVHEVGQRILHALGTETLRPPPPPRIG
jgi:hypothetical protein